MLEKIDIHLTDHCNLNCKGCTHFSPLAEDFYITVEDFEKDLTRLSNLLNNAEGGGIRQIFMLGGEPLLHPQLTEFFPIARRLFPNSKLIIITNGILLSSRDDNFWEACKRSNIQIWVSVYNLAIDTKTAERKAQEFGVFLGYTSTGNDSQNRRNWTKSKLDIDGTQYWVDSFEHCSVKNCVTLKKGKLYTCPTIAHVEHFNKYFGINLSISEFDYIDIYKIQNSKAITDAMVKPVPFCRYCKTREYQGCFWELSKKDISEWT